MSTVQQFEPSVPVVPAAWGGQSRRPPMADTWAADVRAAWRHSLPLVVPIALRVIPGPLRILPYAWAMVYSLFGRRQAIVALELTWFFNMFTHAYGLPPANAAIFRHLTLFAAAVSVFILHMGESPRSRTPLLLVWTAALSLLVICHSFVLSTMPDISVLKAISFALLVQLLLTAWSRLSPRERSVAEKQVWGVLYAIVVCSLPLAFMAAGYFKNERGFQGLLEHPQAFGPVAAIVAVWLIGTWLTDRRMRWSLKAVLAIALASMYWSQARIGALVLISGMLAVVVAGPLTAALNRSGNVPSILKRRLGFAMAGVTAIAIFAGESIAVRIQEFVAKTGKSETVVEAAWESRGHLIERMQQNISERPWTGIGFGVASDPELFSNVVRDPVFGIAVMATVEKGVTPIAMVEEMGWPLALLYAPWFLALLVLAIRAGPRYAGVCAAALTVNLGEAVFFSPGGGGLLVQVIVSMAATAPPAGEQHRVRPVARATVMETMRPGVGGT